MRRLLGLLIIASLASCLFAAGGVFPLSHPVYSEMEALYVLCGNAGLSPSRPWSGKEVSRMLSSLDEASLSVTGKALFNRISSYLEAEEAYLDAGLVLSPEAYWHSNDEDFVTDSQWAYGFNERKPFLSLSLSAGIGPFHTYSELSYGYGRVTNDDVFKSLDEIFGEDFPGVGAIVGADEGSLRIPIRSAVYSPSFLFNLPPMDMLEIDIPRRTALLFSFDSIDFGYLRDRMQWGSARIGNFIFDSHVEKMDRLFLKAQSRRFSFDYVIYLPETDWSNANQNDYDGKSRLMFAHMLTLRPIDRLSISISENVMYSFTTAEPGYFNPATIFHNLNNSDTLNALAHLEIVYVPINGLKLYAQGVLDQATAPTEGDSQAAAFGLDAGASYTWLRRSDIFTVALEGAYTSPYLYRRQGVDFIIFNRYSINDPYGKFPIFTFIGFPYGGDAIAAQLEASWQRVGSLSLETRILYILHGEVGLFSPHSSKGNGHAPDIKDWTPTGEVSHNIVASATLRWPFSVSLLDFEAFIDLSYLHLGGKDDIQLSFGISAAL